MRLIDADWLKDLLLMHEQNARAIEASGRKTKFTYADGIRTGYADVGLCPTIEAEQVRRGKWIDKDRWYVCSECGTEMPFTGVYDKSQRYCFNCGAKMEE